MGLDEGAVGMNTLLEDSPLHLGDWSPVNFDEKFHGMVSVRTALSESLNIPAVRLAAKLGRDRLQGLLARAGLSTFSDPRRHYGLAAVLGGCEVTLLELTNLYASLAQLGLHKPYRVLEDEPVGQGRRLFSEGAAYLVTDILTDVRRPELQEVYESSVSLPRVAWKTGTSYGRRDAWSIGYTRRFTVGVWVGNFDGRGVPELVGARAAAPLLFAVAQILPGVSTERWLEAPSSVVQREVCTVSGLPAAADCPHTRSELAIEDVTPRGRCQMHVRMAVSDDAGHRLCGACRSEHPHHTEVHVQWPASAVPWLESNGVVTSIPQHNPSCPRVTNGTGPVIHTPLDGDRYVMRDGVPADRQQIGLLASSGDGGGGEIFWFVDGALLTRGQSGRPALMNPSPGAHQVVAVDAEGRTAAIQIHIR